MDKSGVLRNVMSMERVMHDTPVLSVIIPTWNRATMVVDTIESALAQDSPEPIEVVVLDDGSTDGTPAVLRTLSQQTLPTNRSLRIIHGDHRGRTPAAQRGLDAAAAPSVSLLASDDMWDPGQARELVAEEHRLGGNTLIYTDWRSVDATGMPLRSRGGGLTDRRRSAFMYDRHTNGPGVLRSYVTSVFRDYSFPGCMCIFPTSMLQGVFRLPEGIVTVDFWIALAGYLQCAVACLDTRSMRRRTHAGQHHLLAGANLWDGIVNEQDRMLQAVVELLEVVVPEESSLITVMRGRSELAALRCAALRGNRLTCLTRSLRLAGTAFRFPALRPAVASNLLIAVSPCLHNALKYGPTRHRLARLAAQSSQPSQAPHG
jgi:glycosyltransferase involved in cell wall biosynthesis